MAHEVWITGAGCLTNLGAGLPSLVDALRKPRSPFVVSSAQWLQDEQAPRFYLAKLSEQAEEEIKPFETVATDRTTAMALAATTQAWQHAGLDKVIDPERVGVYWGTGMGGADTIETTYQRVLCERAVPRPMTVVRIMANAAASSIALKYGLQGANQTYSVACASSAMALGEAMWAIRSGRLDMAVVGGAESMLVPGVMTAWGALRVLATTKNTKNPEQPCRPFSSERSGLVIGEGTAAFILESQRCAIARGATPLAQLAGYASTCDAASLVHPARHGQVRAMRLALQDAALSPCDVDSINAHATATDAGDIVESQAFMEVFGKDGCPSVASTKAMHGHLLGAAGAVEAAMCLATLQVQATPATVGLEPIDPRCEGVFACAMARPGRIGVVLSNSFAFGGANVSLIFKAKNA